LPKSYAERDDATIVKIWNEDKLVIESDKTANLYKVDRNVHEKLLSDSSKVTYLKDSRNIINEVNKEATAITLYIRLQERINCFGEKTGRITLKDHKVILENKKHLLDIWNSWSIINS